MASALETAGGGRISRMAPDFSEEESVELTIEESTRLRRVICDCLEKCKIAFFGDEQSLNSLNERRGINWEFDEGFSGVINIRGATPKNIPEAESCLKEAVENFLRIRGFTYKDGILKRNGHERIVEACLTPKADHLRPTIFKVSIKPVH